MGPKPPNKQSSLPYRKMERFVKGFANHRRIQILELLQKRPELSVVEISRQTGTDFKNAAQHLYRMAVAGLILKRSNGKNICHKLTNDAESVLRFLKDFHHE